MCSWRLSIALLLLVACRGGEDVTDASVDGSVDGGVVAVPVFTPCPSGWHEVTVGDITHCEPYPGSGRLDCPAGQGHFPGEAACRFPGSPCPDDGWPAGLPSDRPVIYVRAGGGGEGTRDSPFPSLTAAIDTLAATMEDKVVALSTGTYDELVWIRGELWGACAAETHITYTGEVTLDPRGDSPALVAARHTKNVSLSGSREVTGISVGLSGSVSGVLLEGFDRGIRGHSGTITVSDTIIRGAQYGMQSGAVFDRDNEFSFEGVIFEDTFVSINVNSFESRTNLLQVRDSAFVGGLAMWLVTTDIDVQRTVFTGGTGSAIVARGGNAVLADVVVERLMSGDGGLDGSGLAFYGGSSDDTLVEIDRVRIEDVRDFALRSGGTGLRVEGRDLLVRGVTPEDCWPDTCPDSSGGVGVVASAGAVDLERFVVQDCSLCGVMVSDEGDLDLRNGRVSGNDLGACLQVDGYDTDRVSDGVIYRDNNSNLEATSLPVPDVMGTLPL